MKQLWHDYMNEQEPQDNDIVIKILKDNCRDLQRQLAEANVRIRDLTEEINKLKHEPI